MKPAVSAAIALTAAAAAQDIAPKDSERDPVLSALLEEQGEMPPPVLISPELAVPHSEDPDSEDAPDEDDARGPDDEPLAEEPPPPAELPGVRVEVEPGAESRHAASEVEIIAPFPAKPLSPAPVGWELEHPEHAPPFSKTVRLSGGSEITLSIRPHVLVPDADGAEVFALSEPGFDPELGYAQRDTVGAVLADSIHALDENADRLDEAARRLQELLNSLPAAPTAEPVAEP